MKINSKILHLPPFISTSWTEVSAIFMREHALHILMLTGEAIVVTGLPMELLHLIFKSHAEYLILSSAHPGLAPVPYQIVQLGSQLQAMQHGGDPVHTEIIRFNLDNMESFASAMQHNPAHAHIPNIPKEVINKIAQVAKIVAPEEISNLSHAEPHCNCPHCQLARAINNQEPLPAPAQAPIAEEPVSDADLKFQQWDIKESGHMLYSVTNRLDTQETYSVHLGEPVGCTCGKHGCEHILAVLRS